MNWIIEDWTGKRMFPKNNFKSFDEGWAFIMANVPDEASWEDIYVVN